MTVLLLPALVSTAFCTPQDEPVVAPPPAVSLEARDIVGATVRTEISVDLELELVESRSTQDGEDVPAEMMPAMERSMSESSSVVFEDTIEDVIDSEATRWARTFEEIEGAFQFDFSVDMGDDFGGEPVSDEQEFETTLSGATLNFTRTDDETKVVVAEGSSVDEGDMEDLEADMSFAFLLPDDAVSEGDTWSLDPSEVERLVHLHEEVAGVRFGGGIDDVPDDVEPEHTGDFELEYMGTVEHDGRTLAVIELHVDVTGEMTFEPEFGFMVEEGDDDMVEIVPDEMTNTSTLAAIGSGKLLWDAEAGHLVELSLALDLTMTDEQSMSIEIPDMGAMDMTQTDVDEGTVKVSIVRSSEI